MKFLRPGLPDRAAFQVTQLPHTTKLDQNESPYDLPEAQKRELCAAIAAESWNRYPQPARYARAKAAFAAAVGLAPERLMLTFGGDQCILAAFWAAGGPGRRALVYEPTYPMFAHYARVTDTPCERVVLGAEMRVAHVDGDFALRCFVSPNNPTGGRVADEVVKQALATGALVLVDEAYADFAGASLLGWNADNLLVGRSLSKSLLAGVRLGYLAGHPEVIGILENLFFAPYHLSSPQLAIAERYADIRPHVQRATEKVRAERTRLCAALAEKVRVFASEANFVLFEVRDAARISGELAKRGIRIRDVSALPGLSSHLRVTVGTPDENDRFLAALADVIRS